MLTPVKLSLLASLLLTSVTAHADGHVHPLNQRDTTHDPSNLAALARLAARHPSLPSPLVNGRAVVNVERAAHAEPTPVHGQLKKKRAPQSSGANAGTGRGASNPGALTINAPGINTAGIVALGSTTTPEQTSPLPTVYPAGSKSPVKGAPNLPAVNIVPANYPALDKAPPTNTPQVTQWLSAIDLSNVPNIAVNNLGGCQNASNAQATAAASTNGWWTCGGTTRASDVTICPTKNTWGVSYDDGPSPDTPRLLNYLDQNQIKVTFFVVGGRVISRPDILQYEYMDGHQICVHTWSHTALTTQTNQQIVAELGWSKYAIQQVLGVTPNCMRPPYGDIDDRVRSISLKMGLTPIIWTASNGIDFDSQDWQMGAGVSPITVVNNFKTVLDGANSLSTGFILLEHDLYQQSVNMALDFALPYSKDITPALSYKPIISCLGKDMSEAYIETSSNSTASTSNVGGTGTGTVPGAPTGAASGTSPSSGTSSGSGAASDFLARSNFRTLLATLGLAAAFALVR